MGYNFTFSVNPSVSAEVYQTWLDTIPEEEQLIEDADFQALRRSGGLYHEIGYAGSYSGSGVNIRTFFPRLREFADRSGHEIRYMFGDYCPPEFRLIP